MQLSDYRSRLEQSPRKDNVYAAVAEAAERRLTAGERELLRQVVAGERSWSDLPADSDGHDPYDDRDPLLVEAGVRFVPGHGWTTDVAAPSAVSPIRSDLSDHDPAQEESEGWMT